MARLRHHGDVLGVRRAGPTARLCKDPAKGVRHRRLMWPGADGSGVETGSLAGTAIPF